MFLISVDYWEVKKTKNKGRGIFTKKKIVAGTVIGDYLGKVIKLAEYDLENDKKGFYLMYLTDETGVYPDLSKPGIHLANHSCSANSWIYIYKGHTLFFALRDIDPHEEITISYLLSPNDPHCDPCPHLCKCESKSCIGSMHLSKEKYQLWQHFQDTNSQRSKIEGHVIGENLPPLKDYPQIDFRNSIYKKMLA